jgi:uncharacterized 2Fe-2S/4Fe-4S cluster protein (DUF4445 family)
MSKKKRRKGRNKKNRGALAKRRAKALKKLGTAWLNVLPFDQWLSVPKKTTLLAALRAADIDLPSDCGGNGKCGKCKVRILTSTRAPSAREVGDLLSDEEIGQGIRLACKKTIKKDLTVYIGESEPDLDYFQILKAGSAPIVAFDPLVIQQTIDIGAKQHSDNRSTVHRLKAALGCADAKLTPSLSCLRSLSGRLSQPEINGTAVVHQQEGERTLLAWNPGRPGPSYGVVFDLGTSTLVATLVNLCDGRHEAAVSCLNSQSKYGADVLTRLQHVEQDKQGLERLHLLLLHNLNNLIKRLLQTAGLQPADIFIAVAAGNTTMQHFLLQIDPTGIAHIPFSPVVNDGFIAKAANVGLALHPEAVLYIMPSQSGYIGGDMLSVILASQVTEQDEKVVLGLDLGTNGELFIGNRKRLLTCSTAAGPAFEGAKISSGSIAKAGAIEGVRFKDGDLHYKDIGNIKPISICGSGLVDLVAVMLDCGAIDRTGRIRMPRGENMGALRKRIVPRGGVNDFLVASATESYHGKPIYLTQKDVRELQVAKSAIAAGITILAHELGIAPREIDYIYLAGALGNYIDKISGQRIGMLPKIEPERIISLGNAASAGAAMVLLSRLYWKKAKLLADTIEHVELSTRPDFSEHFIANMRFPHETYADWSKPL